MDATLDPSNAHRGTDDRPWPVLAGTSSLAIDLAAATARAAHAPVVVVRGPRGSGRDEVAHALHLCAADATGQDDAPFVVVRCSQLVGASGAERLVGAKGRGGLLAAAHGGSLVLDGVEDLEEALQALLAEVLGSGRFLPLGARAEARFDARTIAITGADELEDALVPELAYRLNDRVIDVPALARRSEDLRAIADALLEREGAEARLSEAAGAALAALPWIGGFDEFTELVRRAAQRAGAGSIESSHLEVERIAAATGPVRGPVERSLEGPAPALPSAEALPIGDRSWRSVERALIARVIEESHGNRSLAARVLGFNRSTLYNKLKQYGLENEGREDGD